MKKLFLVIIAALSVTAAANAQTEKGSFIATAGVSNVSLQIIPDFHIGIHAGGGYFIMDDLAIMATLGLAGGNGTSEFGLQAGARYYFGNIFAGADVNLDKYKGLDMQFGLGIYGGYSFFLTDNISIDPTLRLDVPFNKHAKVSLGIGAGFSFYF